jgi:DNA-binding CsgD family transcriptional regulator
VSPATVKNHLDNIYAKLGVGSRAAAVNRAGTTGA